MFQDAGAAGFVTAPSLTFDSRALWLRMLLLGLHSVVAAPGDESMLIPGIENKE